MSTDYRTHLPIDEAIALALEAARALRAGRDTPVSSTSLWDADGQVLAEDVRADRDQPPFDRSAMDGYAIRHADATGPLRLVGEVPAGAVFERPLDPGETVAIMTGAPLPEGADTVVMLENTTRREDEVTVTTPPRFGEHIRRQGENCLTGAVAVEAGRVIDPLTIGVLASVGATTVSTVRRPRVLVVGSGDELVDVGETPGFGQIRDSNRHMLMSLAAQLRANVVDGGRVQDTVADLVRVIREGKGSDVLVISGGVSAGVHDLVARALREEGVEIVFHKAQIKPGKPVLLGTHERGIVLGLPGNPISTYVTAQLFLLPILRVLSGRQHPGPFTIEATLTGEVPPTKGRTTYHPATLKQDSPGQYSCTPLAWSGSGDQIHYSAGNCLIRRDPGAPKIGPGERVHVLLAKSPV